MNFNWRPESPWDALTPYAKIAAKVVHNPEIIRPLIDDRNWRTNLFGVAIAVLADAQPVLDSMINRMTESWAAPQIGAGVALLMLGADEGVRDIHLHKLLEIAMTPPADRELKYLMSAYASIRICSRSHARLFEDDPGFSEKWKFGATWYDLTRMHYERWRTVLPHLAKYVGQAA